jgi:hypothetical protein
MLHEKRHTISQVRYGMSQNRILCERGTETSRFMADIILVLSDYCFSRRALFYGVACLFRSPTVPQLGSFLKAFPQSLQANK